MKAQPTTPLYQRIAEKARMMETWRFIRRLPRSYLLYQSPNFYAWHCSQTYPSSNI